LGNAKGHPPSKRKHTSPSVLSWDRWRGLAQLKPELTETANGLATVIGIISAETRHLTWVNSALQAGDPFVGPSYTVYQTAAQILSDAKQFINGSCPAENPTYPIDGQLLPKFMYNSTTSAI